MHLFVPGVEGSGKRCGTCNGGCNEILDTMLMTQQAHNVEAQHGDLDVLEIQRERATLLDDMVNVGCTFSTDGILGLFAQIAGDEELREKANQALGEKVEFPEEEK